MHPLRVSPELPTTSTAERAPGIKELREAVATYYNTTYRQDKSSRYSYRNVCIVPGGRAGLSRVASVIGEVYAAYLIPEYTAYDQMLSVFRRLVPIPASLSAADKYRISVPDLRKLIKTQGIQVLVASNPRNPTGQAVVYVVEVFRVSPDRCVIAARNWPSWSRSARRAQRSFSMSSIGTLAIEFLEHILKGMQLVQLPGRRRRRLALGRLLHRGRRRPLVRPLTVIFGPSDPVRKASSSMASPRTGACLDSAAAGLSAPNPSSPPSPRPAPSSTAAPRTSSSASPSPTSGTWTASSRTRWPSSATSR
jgi:hypothetical protein